MKHLLIDFENIQPKNLDKLPYDQVQIWLFVGAKQTHLPTSLTDSLLKFKYKPQIIHLKKTGKNVLDFYLSFYLGQITTKDPQAELTILSSDKGYDILFDYIEQQRQTHSIRRINDIHLVQAIEKKQPLSHAEDKDAKKAVRGISGLDEVSYRKLLDIINKNNDHRPKKTKALLNVIMSLLVCDKDGAKKVVKSFKKQGLIDLIDNKVIYKK